MPSNFRFYFVKARKLAVPSRHGKTWPSGSAPRFDHLYEIAKAA